MKTHMKELHINLSLHILVKECNLKQTGHNSNSKRSKRNNKTPQQTGQNSCLSVGPLTRRNTWQRNSSPTAKKNGTTLQNKQTSLNFETIKRLIKQKTQEKFSQEATASSSKTQWQNMGKQQKQTQKSSSRKFPAQHRSRLPHSTPPSHQNPQP
jgi:hypothetical protein